MSLSTDYALFLTLFKTPLTNVKKLHNLIICTAQITKIGHQKLSPSCDQYSFNMSLNCENAVFTLLPINSLQLSPTVKKNATSEMGSLTLEEEYLYRSHQSSLQVICVWTRQGHDRTRMR